MYIPPPKSIVSIRAEGLGDMGTVTDETSIGRFSLDQDYVLTRIRGHFSGGSGSATLSLYVDHRDTSGSYDSLLATWSSVGTGGAADLHHRIEAEEQHHWEFRAGDVLCFTWTNPDSGTMRWALEVGLCPTSELVNG